MSPEDASPDGEGSDGTEGTEADPADANTDPEEANTDPEEANTDPEDAFALIGNETRSGILRALSETPYDDVPFSELRERVDPDIDSGQFNYHLSKLAGTFVDHGDDGYTLRPEGLTLYRTIESGTFNRRATVEAFAAGFDCYFCGTGVEAEYGDGAFELQCPGCDHLYTHTRLPPSAVEGADPETVLSRVDGYNRHELLAYVEGVCSICATPVEVDFLPGEEVWSEGAENLDAFVRHTCPNCGRQYFGSVGHMLLYHPDVIAFFRDHGVDVTSVPHWEFEFVMTDRFLTVRSTDPWEVELAVTRDDETLRMVVDGEMNVLESTRS